MSDKLNKLLVKKKQLLARITKIEQLEKEKERKFQTRKKIIAGSALLKLVSKNIKDIDVKRFYYKCLSLMTEKDRALFVSNSSAVHKTKERS